MKNLKGITITIDNEISLYFSDNSTYVFHIASASISELSNDLDFLTDEDFNKVKDLWLHLLR